MCVRMFLNTLSIGEWTALWWEKKQTEIEDEDKEEDDKSRKYDIKERENVQPKQSRITLFQDRENYLMMFLKE